jgi:hypothetical protein
MESPIKEEDKITPEAIPTLIDHANLSDLTRDQTTVENSAEKDQNKDPSVRPLGNPHQVIIEDFDEVAPPDAIIEENEEERDEQLNNLRDATNSDKAGETPL